jgi:predicted outer membrane repeat protein
VTLANTTVLENYASSHGGGVYVETTGTLFVANSSFFANDAIWHGGGLYLDANAGSRSTAVNCVFTNNTAWRGGGLAVEGQVFAPGLEPVLVNLSVSGNVAAGEGPGIHTNTTTFNPPGGAPITIENSIIWDGMTSFGGSDVAVVNYSIVQGGWANGSHVLSADPSFSDGELRLNLDSPAIDSGDNYAVPLDLYDVDGNHWTDEPIKRDRDFRQRFRNLPHSPNTGVNAPDEWPVDMGAYEAWDPTLIFEHDFDSNDLDPWSNVVPGD